MEGSVYIVDETELDNYSLFSLESKFREVEKIAEEETGHGIDVIVVDHVQLLKFGLGKTTSSGEAINEYVSWFRQQSMDWLKLGRQVAILLLSQSNRAGYELAVANKGKYSLTSIAEANELERASTLVLSVFAEKEMKEMGLAKVQILKYRDASNEDEPTEVNIDLAHYLFGDLDLSIGSDDSMNIGQDDNDVSGNADSIGDMASLLSNDFIL